MSADPMKYRTRFLILTLLAVKPSHGYELSKKIEAITAGLVKASPGTIYPLLRELREQGLVEEDRVIEGGRLRKIYRLTREGARMLRDELALFYDITNRLLELAAEARRSLEQLQEPPGQECPPPRIVRALKRLRATIDEYLESLQEKMAKCRGGWDNNAAENRGKA